MSLPSRPRVLYFALQRSDYPRNQRIRTYLERAAHADIVIVPLSPVPGFARHVWELLRDSAQLRGPFDVVVLAEFSLPFAIVSWLVARRFRALHVIDFFVGPFETHVEDRAAVSPRSFRARALRALEQIAARSGDLLLIDTDVRGDALASRFHVPALTLPVGAPEWARMPPRRRDAGRPRFLYYGNYIPLHGVPQFLRAVGARRDELGDFQITMIGEGDDFEDAKRVVANERLASRVTFRGSMSPEELASEIAAHDVVVGIFGSSAKAESVIANKVWQGLYANRLVVTRDSKALDEIRDLVPDRLIVCDSLEEESIGAALASATRREPESEERDAAELLEDYVASRFLELEHIVGRATRRRVTQSS